MGRTAIPGLLAIAMLAASPVNAQSPERIGATVQVVNEVRAEFGKDSRDLQTGDAVHQNELIDVGLASIGEIVLEDDTKLALGPGSRLLLDRFVYNGKKSTGDIVLDLVTGTFRFMTGAAAKNAYRIRTPAVAITVRGTVFDVFIAPDSAIWLLLMDGAIRACNDRGDCRNLDRPGQILRVSPQGNFERPNTWAQLPNRGTLPFDTAFPFVAAAPTIDPRPALTRDAIVTGRLPKPQRTQSPPPPKKTREAKNPGRQPNTSSHSNAGNPGLGLAIGIGVGIGIGSVIGGNQHRAPGPRHPGGGQKRPGAKPN